MLLFRQRERILSIKSFNFSLLCVHFWKFVSHGKKNQPFSSHISLFNKCLHQLNNRGSEYCMYSAAFLKREKKICRKYRLLCTLHQCGIGLIVQSFEGLCYTNINFKLVVFCVYTICCCEPEIFRVTDFFRLHSRIH